MFSVGFGIHSGCSSSPILFVIFLDSIPSTAKELSVQFGDISIALLIADDVVLLAPSGLDPACTGAV